MRVCSSGERSETLSVQMPKQKIAFCSLKDLFLRNSPLVPPTHSDNIIYVRERLSDASAAAACSELRFRFRFSFLLKCLQMIKSSGERETRRRRIERLRLRKFRLGSRAAAAAGIKENDMIEIAR